MLDKIVIKNIHLSCNIGVPDDERAVKQPIFVDIGLQADLVRAGKHDDITHTVNYADVHKAVVHAAEKQHYKTVEGLAESIATSIKERCAGKIIQTVNVIVRKPYALKFKGVDYIAVEITR